MARLHAWVQAPPYLPKPEQDDQWLVLHGSWPWEDLSKRCSLDQCLDAGWDWVDELAQRWGQVLTGTEDSQVHWATKPCEAALFCFLHALPLRYFLVDLLRTVAFLHAHRNRWSQVHFHTRGEQDKPYEKLFRHWGHSSGVPVQVEREGPREVGTGSLQNSAGVAVSNLRRLLGRMHRLQARWAGQKRRKLPALWLCGNPRVLAPLAPELARAGWAPLWLFPQVALRWWRRSLQGGLGQWFYGAQAGSRPPWPACAPQLLRAEMLGVNLAESLNEFLARRWRGFGKAVAWAWASFRQAWAHCPPEVILLDEDATWPKRLLVHLAREQGVPTVVIQHGVPRLKFGFAPLVADWICVWGAESAQVLQSWEVPAEKILITGSPEHDGVFAPGKRFHRAVPGPPALRPGEPIRVLFLATVWPRSQRPEPLGFHLTEAAYRRLLAAVVECVLECPRTELVIKLHPREQNQKVFRQFVPTEQKDRVRLEGKKGLWDLLPRVHVVFCLASGSGVEAAAAGWPVIELIPPGGKELLPARRWGMVAVAQDASQVRRAFRQLLTQLEERSWQPWLLESRQRVFANFGRPAVPEVVGVVQQVVRGLQDRQGQESSSPLQTQRTAVG